MSTVSQSTQQGIYRQMARIYLDLEEVVEQILQKTGSGVEPEAQVELRQDMKRTEQALEQFKTKYT